LPGTGYYQIQLADWDPNWQALDKVTITATAPGMASDPFVFTITGNEGGFVAHDFPMKSTGPVPHTFTVTLTVTDMLDRTASTWQVVTVYW